MANHHSFQKTFNHRVKESNIASGLSKYLVNEANKMGFSRNHDSLELKKMDSTRILESEIMESNQNRKRRCFEKLVVRRERVDAKCALEVEVIDDTALIEATGSVSGFKKGFKKESDLRFGKNPGNDGKKKNSKESKKQDTKCLMKCVNEKKCNDQVVEDRIVTKKKVSVGKGQIVFRKPFGKVKAVYQRKDVAKIPELVETEKIVQETEVNLNVSNGNEKELTVELVETETVNEKDDGLKLNPEIEVHTENICENTTVESNKIVYSRGELEALRFVNEEGQKRKWTEVYGGFSPLVAKEYTGLVVDVNNRLTQRYNNRVVNCGSGYTRIAGNAILSLPPVLPMCSSSFTERLHHMIV